MTIYKKKIKISITKYVKWKINFAWLSDNGTSSRVKAKEPINKDTKLKTKKKGKLRK
jgi:hypothetical protein